ncbi:MAG TPA: EAL domain-containing protein [Telluria sp.]
MNTGEMDELQQKFKLALSAARMSVWDSTIIEGRVDKGEIAWTADGAALIGMGCAPFLQPFPEFLAMICETHRERILSILQAAVERRGSYDIAYQIALPNGELRWLAAKAQVVCDSVGRPARTLGLIWDISARIEAEERIAQHERLAEVTLRAIGDAVIRTDALGRTTFMNRAAEALTGWSADIAAGHPIDLILPIHEANAGGTSEHPVHKSLRLKQSIGVSKNAQLVTVSGRLIDIEDAVSPIWNDDGELIGSVVVFRDVSHERRMTQQMSWQAKHDGLTGLVNRAEFESIVSAALLHSKEEGQLHALLYMDMDRFKVVNDTCGHAAGDMLLKVLCKLIHAEMRDADVLARLGGDELGALLLNCPLPQAEEVAESLRRAVEQFRFVWDERTFDIGISIGLVEINDESVSTTELLVAADQACYLAKENGGNRVQVYRETDIVLNKKRGERLWLPRLRDAFDKNLFRLFGMPIANLADDGEQHVEVLIRMGSAGGNLNLPNAFIPAAERYKLMHQIDRWVVREVCAHIARRRVAPGDVDAPFPGAGPVRYCINLSGLSLSVPEFSAYINEQFSTFDVDPGRICFEITETAVIANLAHAQTFMHRLRDIGCTFALDDFGSGLSSFGYLKSLPVNFLKVDGLFVRDIAINPVNRAIVQAINQVGHAMNLKTVAEYVEDDETLALVRDMGIDFAQGIAVGEARALTDN